MAGNIPGTKYSTSAFLSKFANLAQSSQYRAHIALPTQFRNEISTSRLITPTILNESGVYCKATSLPGSALATHDVKDFYGVVQKHAYRRQFDGTIDLTFYIDSDYGMLYLFEHWMEYIAQLKGSTKQSRNSYYTVQYPDMYRSSLYIHKFNKDQDSFWGAGGSIVYEFIGAFPQSVSSVGVSYDPSANLEFTVTFAYERYVTDRTGIGAEGMAMEEPSTGKQPLQGVPIDNPSNPHTLPNQPKPPRGDLRKQVQRDRGMTVPGESMINPPTGEPGKTNQALLDVADRNARTIKQQQEKTSNIEEVMNHPFEGGGPRLWIKPSSLMSD